MTFSESYSKFWEKYVDFSSRSSRAEFWWPYITNNIVWFLIFFFESVTYGMPFMTAVFGLAIILPTIALVVRRLHDIDISGWAIIPTFIPYVGPVLLLIFGLIPGVDRENKWGKNPLGIINKTDTE